ncbi:hypothetical protein OC845_003777 [Tilletia horrida]|nr:hypothetical protein OC845_003777 [Tilletia horrida]
MSPEVVRDYSAGEGLRRAVLLRNAVLRQEQELRSQQQALPPLSASAPVKTIPQAFDIISDEDVQDEPVSLSYPWQVSSARTTPISPNTFRSQYIAYDDDSASSSPSSSTSSLESSMIEEREQAWFDDVLSELESGDVPLGASHLDKYDAESNIDEDELLASLTEDLCLTESVSSNSSSLGDLPDLVHSDSENEDDEEDDELDLRDDGANLPSPTSPDFFPKLQASNQDSLNISRMKTHPTPLLSSPTFLHAKGQPSHPARVSQQQADAHDGILHLLPPVFAFPASVRRPHQLALTGRTLIPPAPRQ